MFKGIALVIAATLILLSLGKPLHAASETWEEEKVILERMVNDDFAQSCQGIWDRLWHWAKTGNPEARAGLLIYSLSIIHMPTILAPGIEKEIADRERYSDILLVHTTGGEGLLNQKDSFYTDLLDIFDRTLKRIGYNGDAWRACMQKTPSSGCADILVKAGIVPSFEVFAQGIDERIAKGEKPVCIDGYKHRLTLEEEQKTVIEK